MHSSCQLVAEQDARIGADQHRSALLPTPCALQQQLGLACAAAIESQHQGIQLDQFAAQAAELRPFPLADLGAGIDAPDLQHLPPGELAARKFKQI